MEGKGFSGQLWRSDLDPRTPVCRGRRRRAGREQEADESGCLGARAENVVNWLIVPNAAAVRLRKVPGSLGHWTEVS